MKLSLQSLLGSTKAAVKAQMTDGTEGLQVRPVLVVGVLIQMSDRQQIATRCFPIWGGARSAATTPVLHSLEEVLS
jgi:hypothetical protein